MISSMTIGAVDLLCPYRCGSEISCDRSTDNQNRCSTNLFIEGSHALALMTETLSISFSPGDYAVKTVGVIPDPETFIFELEAVDRFMILGKYVTFRYVVRVCERGFFS